MKSSRNFVWLLIMGYFIWVLLDAFFRPFPLSVTALISVSFLVIIAVIHGLQRYSLKQFLIFFVITFIVSNIYENLSILTGFPFGHYHYTEVLGPKLFLVPLIIAPAYFGAGYLAWSLAHILTGVFGGRLESGQIFRVPLIAAFIMVMWDMQMDPVAATIRQQWIWHDGGCYFGVPFVNFMGWLLCVYTIYQIFAMYISRQSSEPGQEKKSDQTDRPYWYQNIAAYVTMSLTCAMLALTGQSAVVTDATGIQWRTMQIYGSMTLVTIFTMWFVALCCAFAISRRQQ